MFNMLGLVFALLLASALDCPVFADVSKHADTVSGETVLSLQNSFSLEPWRKFQGVFQSMEILAQGEGEVKRENVQHKIRRSRDFVEEGLKTPLWYLYNRLDIKGTSFKQTITWQNKSAKTQTVKLTLRHKAPFSRILWDDKRYDLAELTEPLKLKAYQTETLLTDSRKENFPVIPLKKMQGYTLSFLDEQGRFKGNFSWLDMVNQDQNPEVLVYLAAAAAPDESHLMVVDLVFEFEVAPGSNYVLDPSYDLANMQPGDTVVYGADYVGHELSDSLYSVATATGDFNGDGKMDIIIGAPGAGGPANNRGGAGEIYVIYGTATPYTELDIASLNSTQGLIIYGAEGYAGTSVSAGDFNGDGFSDVIIGAPSANPYTSGKVYVIFGTNIPPSSGTIDILSLTQSQGVVIYGSNWSDYAGTSVSAGDFNGDGFSDVIIGAPGADVNITRISAGEVYVIYGSATPPAAINIRNITSSQGLIIYGAESAIGFSSDAIGSAISAGDFNGDGFSDVIIGAEGADGPNNSRNSGGEVYVIYGSPVPPATIDLLTLNSSQGLIIYGAEANDSAGHSVSAGDFNGDGFSDVIIGANTASGPLNSRNLAGEVYTVYGSSTPPATVDLSTTTFTPSQGLIIYGADPSDMAGHSVSVGDFNGDGKFDVIIGAIRTSSPSNRYGPANDRRNAGEAYVIYGSTSPPVTIDIASLNSSQGLIIYGAEGTFMGWGDQAGYSVGACDFNGDGQYEAMVGARLADGPVNARTGAGEVYLIYGTNSQPVTRDALNLPSSQGIIIYGAEGMAQGIGDQAGYSVSSGDFNGDGMSDLIVGTYAADGPGNSRGGAGEVYVIYGAGSIPAIIDISSLSSSEGLIIYGAESGFASDLAGYSVSSGDFNGDGFSDVIIGAPYADGPGNGRHDVGEVYVIYGRQMPPATIDLLTLTPSDGLIIYGVDGDEIYGDNAGTAVSAGDFNGDGLSDVIIGARLSDGPSNSRTNTGEVYVIYGTTTPPVAGTIDIKFLDPSAGLIIYGAYAYDSTGQSVSAGDYNGDGKEDVIIGASNADPAGRTEAGGVYVIYGSVIPPATVDIRTLASSQGMIIYGAAAYDNIGWSVSAGDFNGDGQSDVIVGAPFASDGGEAYIIYGATAPPATMDLATLTPTDGLVIYNADDGDGAGYSVSAGDFNGDGKSDVIIGASNADGPNNERLNAGEVYVIYGTGVQLGAIDIATLSSSQNTIIYGTNDGDHLGFSLSARDFTGSGITSHLIIGAPSSESSNNARWSAGEIYVLSLAPSVPIADTPPSAITDLSHNPQLTTPNSITLTWTAPGDNGSSGNNGPGAFYTLKYATFPATNKENWFNGLEGTIYTYTQTWTVGPQGSQGSFIVNGLEANTTYYCSVKTTDGANNTSLVDTVVPQVNALTRAAQPGVPANPFLGVNLSSVTVSWLANGNPGYTEYFVQASTVSDLTGTLFYPVSGAVWFTGTLATVVNLSTGAIYYFEVKARNLNNLETSFQVLGSTRTLTELIKTPQATPADTDLIPPAPNNLASVGGTQQVNLSWDAVSIADFSSYRIYRDTATPPGNFTLLAETTSASYVDSGLSGPNSYYYRISTIDQPPLVLESELTAWVTGFVSGAVADVVIPPPPLISIQSVPPSSPGGLNGSIAGSPSLNALNQSAPGQNIFVLQWQPVTSNYDGTGFADPSAPTLQELVGYRVFRATSTTGAWAEIGTIAQPETKWAETFSGKNVFYYKIRAYDDEPSESRDSMIIDSSLHLSTLTNERDAELKVDSSMMSNAYSKFGNFIIRANQKSEDIVGTVLKSVHFEAVDPNTEEVVRNFSFSEPEATITLHYGNSGSGVLASAQEPGSEGLCLYWQNGFEFIKVFGKQNVLDETISLKTPYLGTYQLRSLPRATGFEFASANVSNQLLTPNGDNKNDTVVFIFENPKDSPVLGKVYDLTGAFVAEMTPGPLSNSLEWDGKANGSIVSGGIYIYQIQAEGKTYNGTIVAAR